MESTEYCSAKSLYERVRVTEYPLNWAGPLHLPMDVLGFDRTGNEIAARLVEDVRFVCTQDTSAKLAAAKEGYLWIAPHHSVRIS